MPQGRPGANAGSPGIASPRIRQALALFICSAF